VINTNIPHILHRFRDIAFDVQNRYIWLSLVFNPPSPPPGGEVPLGRSPVKFSVDGTKCRRNIVENFNRLSRGARELQTDRRQTDGR